MFIVSSCNTEDNTKISSSPAPLEAKKPLEIKNKINKTDEKSNIVSCKFYITHEVDSENEMPQSLIYVICQAETTLVAKVIGDAELVEKSQFPDMDIPSNAIDACGSWYAGAGDYFYLVPDKRNMIKVFQGWQDEGQETPGYHWKKVKEIHF
ncbi:MAG: hypothetical protein RL365_1468 [Bacteroidota bacterium]|jgi:hypothetical protein